MGGIILSSKDCIMGNHPVWLNWQALSSFPQEMFKIKSQTAILHSTVAGLESALKGKL